MKILRVILVVSLLLAVGAIATAQSNLEGSVVSKAENTPLLQSSVVLLDPQDSTMVAFAMTDEAGKFLIKKQEHGNYLLQISFIGYATRYQDIDLQDDLDLGVIALVTEAEALKSIEVTADRIPIRIDNDTIIYDANAFKTRPNAVVEDLLKKLPGVEVGKDGSIKAQGEQVQQVLVDGKEFFGNDPKIATKNLPADAIEEVKVFDKQSDMAEFTGIEDGNESKTINLELKEDMKNGYFGKASAGYGTEDRYKLKANVNRFGSKAQMSLIGSSNNINEQDFSIQDYIDLAGGFGALMGNGGGTLELGDDDIGLADAFSGRGKTGLNRSGGLGLNYNYTFNKKLDLRSSYFLSGQEKNLVEEVDRNTFLNDDLLQSYRQRTALNSSLSHKVDLKLNYKIAANQKLTFKVLGRLGNQDRSSVGTDFYRDAVGALQSEGASDNAINVRNLSYTSSVNYMYRFQKKGRNFVSNAQFGQQVKRTNNEIETSNTFYLPDSSSFTNQVEQEQNENNDRSNYRLKVAFTEPLGKRRYIELNAERQNYENELVRDVYDVINQRTYNEGLSQNYSQGYIYDNAGFVLKKNSKKTNITAGLAGQKSQLAGEILKSSETINTSNYRLLPSFTFRHKFVGSKNFDLGYRTSISEPRLDQLKPVVENADPLNIFLGNPELLPEYRHQLNVSYSIFDQFTFTNLFIYANSVYTRDKIVQAQTIDSTFSRTYKPVNVYDDFNSNLNLNFGSSLKPLGIKFNLRGDVNHQRSLQPINSVMNTINRLSWSTGLSIENRKKKKFDVLVGAGLDGSNAYYSENKDFEQSFLNSSWYADLTYYLGERWTFETSYDLKVFGGASIDGSDQFGLMRAAVSVLTLKDSRLQIKLSGFDLLNQNRGIYRNAQFNYIENVRSNTLGRYFLLTLSYSLKGFGKEAGGIKIETNRRR